MGAGALLPSPSCCVKLALTPLHTVPTQWKAAAEEKAAAAEVKKAADTAADELVGRAASALEQVRVSEVSRTDVTGYTQHDTLRCPFVKVTSAKPTKAPPVAKGIAAAAETQAIEIMGSVLAAAISDYQGISSASQARPLLASSPEWGDGVGWDGEE